MPAVCVSRSRMVMGALRRHDAVTPVAVRLRDRRLPVLREVLAHGVADRQAPFLLEHQHADADRRLRLRRDAEDDVVRHRSAGLAVPVPDALGVDDLTAARHQGDGSCQPAVVDVALERLREPFEAFARHAGRFRRGLRQPLRERCLNRHRQQQAGESESADPEVHGAHLSVPSVENRGRPDRTGCVRGYRPIIAARCCPAPDAAGGAAGRVRRGVPGNARWC